MRSNNFIEPINKLFMKIPSTKKYEAALKTLSDNQIKILQTLYYFPNSSATAKQLASALNYVGYQAANSQIGQIGKAIAQYLNILPPVYEEKRERRAYFYLVGEYSTNEGWYMWDELREAMENLKLVANEEENELEILPTEVSSANEDQLFKEGRLIQVFVTRYERNRKARQECINHYGTKCAVCAFDFGSYYGDDAKGFIHVHHLIPISEIKKEYKIDPVKDLIPVCANCHSVIHLTNPAMSIQQLKGKMKKTGANKSKT